MQRLTTQWDVHMTMRAIARNFGPLTDDDDLKAHAWPEFPGTVRKSISCVACQSFLAPSLMHSSDGVAVPVAASLTRCALGIAVSV